jgi:hypothetical protein
MNQELEARLSRALNDGKYYRVMTRSPGGEWLTGKCKFRSWLRVADYAVKSIQNGFEVSILHFKRFDGEEVLVGNTDVWLKDGSLCSA